MITFYNLPRKIRVGYLPNSTKNCSQWSQEQYTPFSGIYCIPCECDKETRCKENAWYMSYFSPCKSKVDETNRSKKLLLKPVDHLAKLALDIQLHSDNFKNLDCSYWHVSSIHNFNWSNIEPGQLKDVLPFDIRSNFKLGHLLRLVS